ncbi:inosine-5-monophosphate dehydrogenase [Polaribacter reichenbachii]|uniref:Inosine-5-monophosphate dehydrogenase n=1 Tax=Polaribacter reichenbachii TaxID=996801 RepID=A0A1B8TZ04_9FLAO|nr:CBS domain-containing protein [Polaribacter reichenbachii]APZ45823.1 inosine-5-monophosphate dehydrogenase [Polaribacter reichenbachii]AUC19685.1 inosine-5-monophosphate dehydrogenase [Polaribacter reichenbachii]OBY64745.1 inosine-5-monophosphate dehydrogenase [Polaribacter reichenbachii]
MGIKSFQGKRDTSQGNEESQILVSDYMTKKLVTFKAEDSLDTVISQLIKYKISGGPVVNDKNELIGIISETDCIKHISESKYYNMPSDTNNTVGKYMVTDVDTIDKDMNIFDAAFKFISSHRRRFPVVDNGKLIGQLSQKDVLKAAIKVKGNTWK